MSEHIKVLKSEGILTLVIDRPSKKNALTDGMYAVLARELEAAQSDDQVRAVVIRSEGEIFSSGNDLMEFAGVAMGAPMPQNVLRFLELLVHAQKPLIAAVQGKAVGVGATLLLHCDYVILSEDAELSMPFTSLALVPEAASTLLLPERIGRVRAFSVFAGEKLDAKTSLAWGLANQVVPLAQLGDATETFAKRLVKQPTGALIATKKLMRDAEAISKHMKVESQVFVSRLVTAEAREAFSAFAERRAPDFTKVH